MRVRLSAAVAGFAQDIALALNVSSDFLLFEEHEPDSSDELAFRFETVSQLPGEEQRVMMEVIESLIIKYQARR